MNIKLPVLALICTVAIAFAHPNSHRIQLTTKEWMDAVKYSLARSSDGSFGATFTSYYDDSKGTCIGGNNAAALDDNSWLWKVFGSGPCPPCTGGRCSCKDGSSCPHGPDEWQCDAYCDDWSPLICGPQGQLKGCQFTACGDAGCARFFIQEGCPCNHPCNNCRGTGCSPPDPIHLDLCLYTSPQVCNGGNSCNGYIKDISCYTGTEKPEWVHNDLQAWLTNAEKIVS